MIEEEEQQHLKQAVKNNHILASSLFIDKEHKICYENREGYIASEREQQMNVLATWYFSCFLLPPLSSSLIVTNMVQYTAAGEIQKKAERYLELCLELKAEVALADETKINKSFFV